MILLELTTKSGSVYQANVIGKLIRCVHPDGNVVDWRPYQELVKGSVDDRLIIKWPGETELSAVSGPITKVEFTNTND